MLKRIALVCLALGLLAGCKVDPSGLADAGSDMFKAATLSKEDLAELGRQTAEQMDAKAKVAGANDKYTKRLNKITAKLKSEAGLKLNYKVYRTNDVNAFALPDGSIRVYSGLMDMMNDDELFFILGHEIGHVADGDAADKFKMAYVTSGARKAAEASGHGVTKALSASQLGDIGEKFIHAQFSQSQESDADKYGFNMMTKYGKKPASAVSALRKLGGPGRESSMFDTHPASEKRADAIEKMIK